ncbi:zinc finger and SCAN domain-containing protein 12-like [Belonocnema kinseyi]|uniref:zinc finger and SCAN domain-containing protein 12-like n=1 Tax=Belonocnema kinseyi TaxID=2817044 RepID=UPI00143D890B|nr:zinc finger and SCAN domain-containing protein 12-like [Belonocnema kinseyi]
MPTRNSLKKDTESPKTVWVTAQSPKQVKSISENSQVNSENQTDMKVVISQNENSETVQKFPEGSTLMTFANGSMKVPNFVITNVQSLASGSKIQKVIPLKKAQNIVLHNLTPGARGKNIGRFSKVSNASSPTKVSTSFIKEETMDASPSQDTPQWMNTPIKRYVAKRKIIPEASLTPKVENADDDHAYVNKYQSPIITLKRISPPNNQTKSVKISDRICRLCLKYKDNLTPLCWGDRTKPQLVNFLKICCTLEVIQEDPMPKWICNDCRIKLLAAWDFRNQCQKSDNILRKYYKLPEKNDPPSEADKSVVEQKDKAIQVQCFDRSKKVISIQQPLKTETIKEDKESIDKLEREMDIVGNINEEENEDIDENAVSYFLESFAQEISHDIENSEADRPEEANEVESSEEQEIHQQEEEEEEEEEEEAMEEEKTEAEDEVDVKDEVIIERKRTNPADKGLFLCHMCPRVFTTKKFLERHANLHLTKKTYACDTCGKVFKTEEKLTGHLRVHDKTKRFECDVCGLKYAYEYLLNSHLRLHGRGKPFNTEKNFLCEVCSKSFVSQSGLKHHQKLHMDVKPYKCKFCDKTFTMPIYRKKHEVRHAADRQFKCHLCPAIYASTNGLTNHLLRHTGEAHYHCETCGKSFRRRKYLNEHTYTHTGEKPYICKMCGIGYGNSGSLFAHQKRCKLNFLDELEQPVNEEILGDE